MRTSPLIPMLGAMLAGGGPAMADFVGIEAEIDVFGLDGLTPLLELEGYAGQTVINVYATFDDESDQALGVVGTPETPFQIQSFGLSGFVNVGFDLDTPPPSFALDFFPELHWDSFMTVGLKVTGPEDALIVAPGTPGPNTDPWPDPPGANMAWTVPPSVNGGPPPQSLAGEDRRVLRLRLVLPPEEFAVGGSFGLLLRVDGQSFQTAGGVLACCAVPVCGIGPDCNGNDLADACDVVQGRSADVNGNGIPDECECLADVAPAPPDGPDGLVDVLDLVQVILQWGTAGTADANGDSTVDVQDLVVVISSWGACE